MQAAGLASFGATDVLLLVALAFGSFYVAHGATWPLLSTVLHARVTAAHRSTAVSAMSLAMSLGGITGNLVLPRIAAATSMRTAFFPVAGLTLLSALLCLRLPNPSPRDVEVVEPADDVTASRR